MNISIGKSWKNALKPYIESKKFQKTIGCVENMYRKNIVFPKQEDLFRAFSSTSFNQTSVVILGQDPYHKKDQANGLAFSVSKEVKIPPSLRNIYKEITTDIGSINNNQNGDLSHWANQGVLLLNSVLSVTESLPGSHANIGWEEFTDHVIKTISNEKNNCVFILWGNYAQNKKILINTSKHLVLTSSHPSPLSAYRGFWGNKHFSRANTYLRKYNKKPIIW